MGKPDPENTEWISAVVRELLEEIDTEFSNGPRFIFGYRDKQGRCEAKEFILGLPLKVKAVYYTSFRRYCSGQNNRGERWHPWNGYDGLADYKDNGSKSRIMSLSFGRSAHVLLFGFTGKKEDKVDEIHVNKAVRMRDEFRARAQEIWDRIQKRRGKGK